MTLNDEQGLLLRQIFSSAINFSNFSLAATKMNHDGPVDWSSCRNSNLLPMSWSLTKTHPIDFGL